MMDDEDDGDLTLDYNAPAVQTLKIRLETEKQNLEQQLEDMRATYQASTREGGGREGEGDTLTQTHTHTHTQAYRHTGTQAHQAWPGFSHASRLSRRQALTPAERGVGSAGVVCHLATCTPRLHACPAPAPPLDGPTSTTPARIRPPHRPATRWF